MILLQNYYAVIPLRLEIHVWDGFIGYTWNFVLSRNTGNKQSFIN